MPVVPGTSPAAVATPPRAALRRPALAWALLHVPLVLLLYGTSLRAAGGAVRPAFQLLLWPAFAAEASFLTLLAFAVALPFSLLGKGRAYRWAAPAATAF